MRDKSSKLSQKTETGFPSPAADHLEKALNLEDLIVQQPAATFYIRAEGNSMRASGINDRDILVVDRSILANDRHLVVAAINEEPIIRRLVKKDSRFFLVSDDNNLEPIIIRHDTDWIIWGVITWVIHRFV